MLQCSYSHKMRIVNGFERFLSKHKQTDCVDVSVAVAVASKACCLDFSRNCFTELSPTQFANGRLPTSTLSYRSCISNWLQFFQSLISQNIHDKMDILHSEFTAALEKYQNTLKSTKYRLAQLNVLVIYTNAYICLFFFRRNNIAHELIIFIFRLFLLLFTVGIHKIIANRRIE